MPLAFTPATADSYVLPKLLLARSMILALAALWLARAGLERKLVIRRSALDFPVLAFVLSALVSSVLAVNRNLALFGSYERYEGLTTIASYAGLFWLVLQTVDRSQVRGVLRCLMLGAYAASLIAICQSILGSFLLNGGSAETAFQFGAFARAQGMMGNPNLLGALLALVLPLALDDLIRARERGRRLIALSLILPMALALLLTFGRGAWIGAAVGCGIVIAPQVTRLSMSRVAILGIAVVAAAVMAAALLTSKLAQGLPLAATLADRVITIANPLTGSGATRLHVWGDTLQLIASHPMLGYGPDNFGLVYPAFQTGVWTPGFLVDKAHADILQIGATQGLLGVLAFIGIVAGIVICFRKGRRVEGALPLLAGVIAYQLQNQVNFSWLPSAGPFWIFLALAVLIWSESHVEQGTVSIAFSGAVRGTLIALAALLVVAAVPAVIRPYQADVAYADGLHAEASGDRFAASTAIDSARRFAPDESVYAVEAGSLAFMRGDSESMRQAASAYQTASALGTANPAAFRNLALAERLLGRDEQAVAAARRAIELDPFDGAGAAVFQTVSAQ